MTETLGSTTKICLHRITKRTSL